MIGQTISHYRITELLGAGGMGEVYKAEDTRLRRAVALKFLALALVQDSDAKERLVQEAQSASALDHPNICTIYEIDETSDGRLFLAMAHYEGETLKQRIARGPLPVDEALGIIAQVANAVSAAHEAGIIHRDIKPANIMLTKKREVKLLDFGLAKLAGRTALTRTGSTLGTANYMSPEQTRGQEADERSDVWALGVVLYEMLTGKQPFSGPHEVAVLGAIATATPLPMSQIQSDVPARAQAIVDKALQKTAKARYASAREFLADVESLVALRNPQVTAKDLHSPVKSRAANLRTVITAAAALLAVIGLGGWFTYRYMQVSKARKALSAIADLIQQEHFAAAYREYRRVKPTLSGDPDLIKLENENFVPVSIQTEPTDADVYIKGYGELKEEWLSLGRAPIKTRLPFGYFRWRITKPGYTTFEGANGAGSDNRFVLTPGGSAPEGMVQVPGRPVQIAGMGPVLIPDFFIDRYEVTNREYKKFIEAGGYGNKDLWTEPFMKDGHAVPREQAMAEFRDMTGQPGPSTWELGTYPEGQDNYPVQGISWYEAAAFARYAGKTLPTVHHWQLAASLGIYSDILGLSNFSGKGPAPVGANSGIGPYGTYDMAGNVKEWCWNEVRNLRYILGGGWNEPDYQFRGTDALSPFDRSSINGLRLMKVADKTAIPEASLRPIEGVSRDYSKERPVSDDRFKTYARLFEYDRTDIKPIVEQVDDSSSSNWRKERVTFAAPYGNERIIAFLYLPRNTAPPYQTVVYFPHLGALYSGTFEPAEMSYLAFLVQTGRALLVPMYKGTYERRLPSVPAGPNAQRDIIVQQIKEVSRSIDYLETRKDIDHEKLAYFGVSLGAMMAPMALAVDHRFKAAVLWSGGLPLGNILAEVDPINFAPHVTTPIMMANGKDDFTFPVKESQEPLFRLLGSPVKKQVPPYPGGHIFPFARIKGDTLDWFDQQMGKPR